MSAYRQGPPFYSIPGTTAPSFSSTLGSTSQGYALEASTLGRLWQGPTNRSVRLATIGSSGCYWVAFGTSTIQVGGATDGILILGGTVESFGLDPGQSWLAIASSTSVSVNITPGYGS